MRASVVVALWVALISSSWAADVSQVAKKYRQEGASALKLGRYEEAISQYEKAYALDPDDRTLYNFGVAHWRLYELHQRRDDLTKAHQFFEKFLDLVHADDPRYAKTAQQIEGWRTGAKEYLEKTTAERAKLDAAALPPTPTAPLTPSPSPATAKPVLQPSLAAPLPAMTASTSADAPTVQRSFWRPPWPVWALYGAAGGFGIAAIATGVLQRHAEDDNSAAVAAQDKARANDTADRSRNLALTTNIFIGVAAASAVAGLTWHLWDHHKRKQAALGEPSSTTTIGLGPSGAMIGGTF